MKNRFILFAVLFVFATMTYNAKAFHLVPYGKIGYYAMTSEINVLGAKIENSYSGLAWGLGLQVELGLSKSMTINPGLEYFTSSYEVGIEKIISVAKYEVTDSYFSVPVIVNYCFSGVNAEGLSIGAGPKFNYYLEDEDANILNTLKKTAAQIQEDDKMDNLSVSIVGNISYQLALGLKASAVFEYSLTNLSSIESVVLKPYFLGAQIAWRF
ncbi:MAG: PorT family protein [Ignavibacteria bacterium]|jgi:hypothetical protein|nr:PorT family protein [Ignavibacteria bacterium]